MEARFRRDTSTVINNKLAKYNQQPETIGELLKATVIAKADFDAAVEAFLANPGIGRFELAPGCAVDITMAVKGDRHATATLTEPTAKEGSRRVAVKSALLLARPLKT